MQVEWYGQSAFRLSTADTTVAIDPFGDMSGLASEPRHAVRLSADRGRQRRICCW